MLCYYFSIGNAPHINMAHYPHPPYTSPSRRHLTHTHRYIYIATDTDTHRLPTQLRMTIKHILACQALRIRFDVYLTVFIAAFICQLLG